MLWLRENSWFYTVRIVATRGDEHTCPHTVFNLIFINCFVVPTHVLRASLKINLAFGFRGPFWVLFSGLAFLKSLDVFITRGIENLNYFTASICSPSFAKILIYSLNVAGLVVTLVLN